MVIAVDFDGTIVEHRYPAIGKEIPSAVTTLKLLASEGHTLILWTVREGREQQEAVEWCKARGLEFFAVNANVPDETPSDKAYSRKLQADLFIDDRSFGGLPDWGTIYHRIREGKALKADWAQLALMDTEAKPEPKGFLARLLGR